MRGGIDSARRHSLCNVCWQLRRATETGRGTLDDDCEFHNIVYSLEKKLSPMRDFGVAFINRRAMKPYRATNYLNLPPTQKDM